MRSLIKLMTVVGGALVGALLIAAPAFGGSISSPSSPYNVPGDGSGNPVAFDVTVSGFTPGQQVYLEQCDGKAPTTPGWDPTIDCDNGTSPAAGIADGSGNYTFHANDVNHAFTPFKGQGPSGGFDCLSANDPAPSDGLPQYRNCQLRASSNNGAATSDQSFITLNLPDAAAGAPEVPVAVILPLGAIVIGGGFLLIRRRRTARAAA